MMHAVSAVVALVALVLYSHRSGWLYVHGTQSFWALVTRAGMAGVLATVAVAFVDLAAGGEPFEWRHSLVLGALCLSVGGHLGLAYRGPTDPT